MVEGKLKVENDRPWALHASGVVVESVRVSGVQLCIPLVDVSRSSVAAAAVCVKGNIDGP